MDAKTVNPFQQLSQLKAEQEAVQPIHAQEMKSTKNIITDF